MPLDLDLLTDTSTELKTEELSQAAQVQVTKALLKCSLPSDCIILKVKWIKGISEPTLIYLAKSSSDIEDEYFIDVA